MVAFTATLAGYIYTTVTGGKTLGYLELALIACVFALLSGYIAFRGISGSTTAAIMINVIQITSLVAFSIVAIIFRVGHPHAAGGYEHASAFSIILPHSFINLVYQSTIAILLLVGFESITSLGAEALRPEKDIRRGILLSLMIQGGICYLFEYFAANFAVGGATISSTAADGTKLTGYGAAAISGSPAGDMIKTIGDKMLGGTGNVLAMIMAATVLLALIGTTLACLNTGVRITYAMGRDKEMPGILGLLHGRFATPHGGIWVLTIISAVLGIYGVKSVDNLTQMTLASNTGTFLVYGMTCLITIVAFASRHDRHALKHYVVPGLGMFMNIAELFGVVYLTLKAGGATGRDGYIAIGIVLVWCVLGLVWVLSNPRMRGAKLFSDPRGSGRPAAEELPPPAESAESAEEPTPSSGEVTLEA